MQLFEWAKAPAWLSGVLVMGIYRTLAWVLAIMLPVLSDAELLILQGNDLLLL